MARAHHDRRTPGDWLRGLFRQPPPGFYSRPAVYLSGDRMEIERFCTVLFFDENRLCLRLAKGRFTVYGSGLRIIEVYKHQFQDLNDVIAQIKNRNYKFIIYMDDLSFEEFEIEYKYLKAVIEGGLEKKPENVLIYATSNRRHLIRETFKDKQDRDEELHVNDTVQEKLSLVSRFGVSIYFGSPDKKQFQQIVQTLADRYGVAMSEDELLLKANQWELSHGGLSGRTAQQFIDYLLGQ